MADDDLVIAVRLQRQLIEEHRATQRESSNGQDKDEDAILTQHEDYLESIEQRLQDSRMARSIAQAVEEDAATIETARGHRDPSSLSNEMIEQLSLFNGNTPRHVKLPVHSLSGMPL